MEPRLANVQLMEKGEGRKFMEQQFMKERKILPLVLSMSLPMVLSMAVNSLYNIVDSYFVAKISEDAMTALSLVYPIQNLISAIAVGFSIGINAVVSYHLGAQNKQRADDTATQGVLLSFLHGILLTIGTILFIPHFLRLFTSDEKLIAMGVEYANIVFAFSIVITVGIAFEKIFQAVGMMNVSMISMMAGCIVNIILDPIFIFGLGPIPSMKISGAAIATGIGQVVSLVIYLYFYKTSGLTVKIRLDRLRLDNRLVWKLYSIGVPATLNMGLASFLISALNGILAAYSTAYVLVLGVYYKLQTFLYLPANGIVQGIRPLVGYNYGAREYDRVQKIYRTALTLAYIIMIVGTALCWIVPRQLIGLFTTNESTISLGVTALHVISLGFIVSAVSIVSSGALEGLGKGMPSLVISLLRYIIIIIPAAFILSRIFGAVGVWWAFVVAEFVTAIVAYGIYKKNSQEEETSVPND